MKAENALFRTVPSKIDFFRSSNQELELAKLKRSRRERSNEGSHHYGPNLRGRVLGVMLSGHPLRGGTPFFSRRGQNFLVICHTYHSIFIYARGKSVPRAFGAGRSGNVCYSYAFSMLLVPFENPEDQLSNSTNSIENRFNDQNLLANRTST